MNFLALEPLIVARLVARLDSLVPALNVQTAPTLAGVTEAQQASPAVHVVYLGSRVRQMQALGRFAEVEQSWSTVVAVRNVASAAKGQAARADAGALLSAVWTALAGWRASEQFTPLLPSTPMQSGYTKGFAYHPLEWTTRLIMKGEPND